MTKRYLTSLALTALCTIAGSASAQSVCLAVAPESKLNPATVVMYFTPLVSPRIFSIL